MESVFVVQHLRVDADGCDNVKFIGVYRTRDSAEGAVLRLAVMPGFRELPDIVDVDRDPSMEGFHIDEYALDVDHWQEGYGFD